MARKIAASTTVMALALVVLSAPTAPAKGLSKALHARISVSPDTGGASTRFSVGFRAPQRTGRLAHIVRRYELSVSGRSGAQGCVSSASLELSFTRAHARVRATLNPARLGGRWCWGTFHGQVEETEAPICPRATACPALVVLLGTVGKFSFVVKAPPGGDVVSPTFAGLKGAFACTPGPQRPGQTTPFTLTWDAATDNVTPSSQIVYDVYESGTAGDEKFASPTWTTAPGVTRFRTPGLASHGTFYFVVRARDQAGNQDRNRVERLGSDPCL
jgi:hypothetical protein